MSQPVVVGAITVEVPTVEVNVDVVSASIGGVTTHGQLSGLSADDHPQYLTQGRGDARYALTGASPTDHGQLTGLSDDDHPQYHTDARGDARYPAINHTHTQITSHGSPDTDVAATSLHHTLGIGAFQAAPGNHNHSHTALTGLSTDDHPQYLTPARVLPGANITIDRTTTPGSAIIASTASGTGGTMDHHLLTNLTTGDDHTQYFNLARADARYSLLSHSHGTAGGGGVYVGPSTATPAPATYSLWVVTA